MGSAIKRVNRNRESERWQFRVLIETGTDCDSSAFVGQVPIYLCAVEWPWTATDTNQNRIFRAD